VRFRYRYEPTRRNLPDSGQELGNSLRNAHHRDVLPDPRLVRHVVATTGLAPAEATRLIGDVLAFHHEPVEAYVRRRHGELKLRGAKNVDIFNVLRDELADRLVAAPDLSERQLRRMIYG
jgi:hypothetical protein